MVLAEALLLTGCSSATVHTPTKSGNGLLVGTTTTCLTGTLGPGGVPNEEQIKHLGANGGGCFDAVVNSVVPTTTTAPSDTNGALRRRCAAEIRQIRALERTHPDLQAFPTSRACGRTIVHFP